MSKLTKKYLLQRVKNLEEQLMVLSEAVRIEFYNDFREGYYADEVTLRGSVEAILEHLGLDVDVKEETRTPAHVVVKKVKKAKK
jgi:hypothetical protein